MTTTTEPHSISPNTPRLWLHVLLWLAFATPAVISFSKHFKLPETGRNTPTAPAVALEAPEPSATMCRLPDAP